MKALFIIVFLYCCAAASFAQRVPSSCDAPDSVRSRYREDAASLSLFYENKIKSSYLDSILISQSFQDYFAGLLYAVYNATNLQARDTILLLKIHDYNVSSLHKLLFTFDTTVAWGKRLSQSIFPTGNAYFDSLLQKYNITVDSIWFDHLYGGSSILHTLQPLNLYPLIKALDKSCNFRLQSRIQYDSADGDLIDAVVNKDSSVTINFSYGWDLCPNACRFRRYWEFTVFPDCSVQFDSSYGDALPLDAVISDPGVNTKLVLYPNPTSGKLTVETLPGSIIEILDVQGKILTSFHNNQGESELDVSLLPKGMYFARITNSEGKATTVKFLKD
jgi:hypothetical protein